MSPDTLLFHMKPSLELPALLLLAVNVFDPPLLNCSEGDSSSC